MTMPAAASASLSLCCCGDASRNPASTTSRPRHSGTACAIAARMSGTSARSIAPRRSSSRRYCSAQAANIAGSDSAEAPAAPLHARQLSPPAPQACTSAHASAARAAAPCGSSSGACADSQGRDQAMPQELDFNRRQQTRSRDDRLRVARLAPERCQPGGPRQRARGGPRPMPSAHHGGVVTRDQRAREPVVRRDERCACGERRGEIGSVHGSGRMDHAVTTSSAARTRETVAGLLGTVPASGEPQVGRAGALRRMAMRINFQRRSVCCDARIATGREGPTLHKQLRRSTPICAE